MPLLQRARHFRSVIFVVHVRQLEITEPSVGLDQLHRGERLAEWCFRTAGIQAGTSAGATSITFGLFSVSSSKRRISRAPSMTTGRVGFGRPPRRSACTTFALCGLPFAPRGDNDCSDNENHNRTNERCEARVQPTHANLSKYCRQGCKESRTQEKPANSHWTSLPFP
jgi:hypothetical protein